MTGSFPPICPSFHHSNKFIIADSSILHSQDIDVRLKSAESKFAYNVKYSISPSPCQCLLLGRCHLPHLYNHLLHLPSRHPGAHLVQCNHCHPCRSRRMPCEYAHHWPSFGDEGKRQQTPHSLVYPSH